MGTHPIFESDFDCLTEMSFKMHGDANQVNITNPNAFRPANNEEELIKLSPIPNPVKDSKLHSALNRELKLKSNAGTIFERNELQKVFHQRRIKSSQKEVIEEKTPIQAELEGRLKARKELLEPEEKPETSFREPKPEEIPEFLKIKLKKNVASF